MEQIESLLRCRGFKNVEPGYWAKDDMHIWIYRQVSERMKWDYDWVVLSRRGKQRHVSVKRSVKKLEKAIEIMEMGEK